VGCIKSGEDHCLHCTSFSRGDCENVPSSTILFPKIYEGSFAKFVDWLQCTAFMQREAVNVMPSCIGGGNVVVASSSSF
jgi:hypothetical protein